MIKDVQPITSSDFNKGLVTRSDILKGDINASPNTMDVQWNFDSSLHKRLGCSSTNSLSIGSTAVASWIIDSNGTLSTNLSSYWNLNEPSGGRADSVAMSNLNDINSTGSISGIRGLAALFIAANSNALVTPSVNALTGGPTFSISSWFYLNSTSGTAELPIVSKRDLDAYTTLLLHCDGANSSGTFTDSSIYAHAISTSGTARVDTGQQKFGTGSVTLDAASYLNCGSNSDYAVGTGDFTIDFWVRFNTINTDNVLFDMTGNTFTLNYGPNDIGGFRLTLPGTHYDFLNNSLLISTWYHIAITRSSTSLRFFLNGAQVGAAQTSNDNVTTNQFVVGDQIVGGAGLNGWIDEFRLTKGVARWVASFTPPSAAYLGPVYEYYLYVNSNNNATFRVSSSGLVNDTTVQATSIGALNTSTWYNVIAWHSGNSHIGISVNLSVNTAPYTSGLFPGQTPFMLGSLSNTLTGFMDGRIDETGFWNKILSSQERSDLFGGGSGNTFTPGLSAFSWASFDFGASPTRWLTVANGTGILASSNRGVTFITIATSRTQTYQSLNRSNNVLIATSDAYDVPLYWAGSAGTFAATVAPGSAPGCKYSINYNGFLILLNSQLRKRGFFYANQNTQLTDPWTNSFDLPSSADDEITGAFVLYKFLYISTRYKLYRMAYVGGNPDWSYLEVKQWGYTPRTADILTLEQAGQVAIGLDWNARLRMFDGFYDRFISNNIENDNKLCDFATNKISYAGSGLQVCHGLLNPVTQEYRLNVAIGSQSTQTTHAILLNARNNALYPYSNQQWQTMCVAESNNQRALMAFDRSGFCYILDSGNLDGVTAVAEVYDTPPLFTQSPEVVSKGHQLNLFFGVASCGTIYQQSRIDLSNQWGSQRPLSNAKGNTSLTGTENAIKILRTIDVKETYNTIQFRITSSSGTLNAANPWELDRLDFLQQGFGIGKGV